MQHPFTVRTKASREVDSSKSLRWTRFGTAEDGATLVEIALASSILFTAVFGIIILSLALYTYDFVADAARIGARYAIVRGSYCTGFTECSAGGATATDISNYVTGLNYPGIDPANLTVTAAWYNVNQVGGAATTVTLCSNSSPTGCNVPRKNAVAVTVLYAYPLNIPYFGSTTLNLTSTSQLVISQ